MTIGLSTIKQRFEIKAIERLDFHAGWIIDAKAIAGQHAETKSFI